MLQVMLLRSDILPLAILVEINITHFFKNYIYRFTRVNSKHENMYYLRKLTAVSVLIYISCTVALKNLQANGEKQHVLKWAAHLTRTTWYCHAVYLHTDQTGSQ